MRKKLRRGQLRTLVAMMTGHDWWNFYQHKYLHKGQTIRCDLCGDAKQDSTHILCACPTTNVEFYRQQYLDNLKYIIWEHEAFCLNEETFSFDKEKWLYLDYIIRVDIDMQCKVKCLKELLFLFMLLWKYKDVL